VETANAVGWSADALDGWHLLFAVRGLRGLPLTFPAPIGVATAHARGLLAQP